MSRTVKPEFVFMCNKCGHEVYGPKDIKIIAKIFKKECPNCGEEPYNNWTISREGDFKKEYKDND